MKKLMFTLLALLVVFSATNAKAVIIDIYSLTNTTSNPVTVNFAAGTYDVTPIGIADGGAYNSWNAWGSIGGCNPDGTCSWGWLNNYTISSISLGERKYSDDVKYSTDLLALDNAVGTQFTLASSEDVNLYIMDSYYSDNIDGMSLEVTSVPAPIPEPGTILFLGSGFVGLVGFGKKFKV